MFVFYGVCYACFVLLLCYQIPPTFIHSNAPTTSWRFEDGGFSGGHGYEPTSLDKLSSELGQSMLHQSIDLSASSDRTGFFNQRSVAQSHMGTSASTGSSHYDPSGRLDLEPYGSGQAAHFPFTEASGCSELRPPCLSNHVRSTGIGSVQRLSTETH